VSVALTNHGPSGLRGLPTPAAVGRAPADDPETGLLVYYRTISAGYFSTVGTDLITGREFTEGDMRGPEGPVIINEALAAQFGGATAAVGATLGVRKAASSRTDFGEPLMGTIVGVVSDLSTSETAGSLAPVVYVPFPHTPWTQARLLVRAIDASEPTVRAVEAAVRAVEPRIPLSGPFVGVWRDADLRADERSRERLNAGLTAAFGMMALLLATIGMYGVTSFVVTLRTREMGVRLALGASPTRVALDVLKRAAVVCSIGLTAGAVAALIASRSMTTLLFAVDPLSPARYFIIAAVLASVTVLAAYTPARRASRLDPASVIRVE
jgi:ABC-type antimicrobial peptide transport system permease subunit